MKSHVISSKFPFFHAVGNPLRMSMKLRAQELNCAALSANHIPHGSESLQPRMTHLSHSHPPQHINETPLTHSLQDSLPEEWIPMTYPNPAGKHAKISSRAKIIEA